jgi:hypothetical protein
MSALKKLGLLALLCAAWPVHGQGTVGPYPKMAPLDRYLMQRDAEIALARGAAPDSISREADVFVLGAHGYEAAVKGKNGFVCAVLRSWVVNADDPGFWNPRLRAPICFNAAAARSYWPIDIKKTELLLAGMPKDRMFETIQSRFDNRQLPALEPGAMCYMMSRDGYLNDTDGHWHPHLMFFVPQTSELAWGAGLPGAPIFAAQEPANHVTVFMIPVKKWSDGMADQPDDGSEIHSHKH